MIIEATPHKKWSATITQATVGSSDTYVNMPIPATLALTPSGGTAVVEYTLDPTYTVWQEWADGAVGVYTEDTLVSGVLGLRLTVVSGTAILNIVGGA